MNEVWIRLATETRYHVLLTIGVVRHVTSCRQTLPADEPVVITATEPPRVLACPACKRDLDAKRARVPTIDLRPSVREVGAFAELDVDATVIAPRTLTEEWR